MCFHIFLFFIINKGIFFKIDQKKSSFFVSQILKNPFYFSIKKIIIVRNLLFFKINMMYISISKTDNLYIKKYKLK